MHSLHMIGVAAVHTVDFPGGTLLHFAGDSGEACTSKQRMSLAHHSRPGMHTVRMPPEHRMALP